MNKISKTVFFYLIAVSGMLCFLMPTRIYPQDESFNLRTTGDEADNQPNVPEAPPAQKKTPSDVAVATENKTSDESITVNFENVDIRDVIRILADKAQLNMVVGPEVAATVNLQLTNVSWQQALDVILKTYNLTYKRDGDLVRIMTLEQLQAEDEKIPLATRIVTMNFARAGEIKSNFENMLSSRGRIDINERTNSLIVTDIPDNITKIEEIAVKLDTRTPQVMIEALMADVVVTQDDQLGINWDLSCPDRIEAPGADQAGRTAKRTIEQNLGALGA